jgi:predicted secreted protein
MNIFSGIVVFILIWWIVFFCMLPMNIQNIDKPAGGVMPGAPVNPGLKRKAILATVIACVGWLVVYGIIKADIISYRDIAQKMNM